MPGANKSGSKYSIAKNFRGGGTKPEKTNIELVPLETKEYFMFGE